MTDRTDAQTHLPRLLVVDDDPSILEVIGRMAKEAGFEVVSCRNGSEALEHLRHHHADLAAVDLRMPDVGGMEVLRAIREADPDCQVILMSGDATMEDAVEAIKLGAVDCLSKPFDFARLKRILSDVREDATRRRLLLEAEREVADKSEFCGMVGRSAVMQGLFILIRRLAPHARSVLITGETGTGKELVARALHRTGARRDKRFVTINCSAVVETLFESELFGHARGAFTGAVDSKLGLFEMAHGGTLFLDEIGELPLVMQAKLLRVLESGEVQRVGALEPRLVDVHVLAATNRNLLAETAVGRFRNDLYYRLNVIEIRVPALRDRREDIPYLTAAFVRECSVRLGKRIVGLTPAAERKLVTAEWSGNVRELRNVIERACILADSEFIADREFSISLSAAAPGVPARAGQPDEGTLSAVERDRIVEVMAGVGGNKSRAARILGLDRRSLYRRLELYGIDKAVDGS
ncbi:MAG: sigma 54-interacting transcriptional regulator [Gemmatimonadaceae bacterium]